MMATELLLALIRGATALSVSVLLIRLLRRPVRVLVGAQLACWLWLFAPAVVVAVLLPAPTVPMLPAQIAFSEQTHAVLTEAVEGARGSSHDIWVVAAISVWALGAAGMTLWMFLRQLAFRRSLGELIPGDDGLYRADNVPAPMLIDSWRPRIVVPQDFESRFSPDERELVVAHERAHLLRRDLLINLVASAALCTSWFNPLIYRALAWLRMDQDLACDAVVLTMRRESRRKYAETLLKAQIAGEVWRQPIGCYWRSVHPLKERINMLKQPTPGRLLRSLGFMAILAFAAVASYGAWAERAAQGDRPILVNLKATLSNLDTREVREEVVQYVVNSGEAIKELDGRAMHFACTPYLGDVPGHATDFSNQNQRGTPLPQTGQILVDCVLNEDGVLVRRPAVIVSDGGSGTIEISNRDGSQIFKIEITASSSADAIAAAKKRAEGH